MRSPEWGEEFQRLVLACAVGSDLLATLPSALRPELFGPPPPAARSPRQRIAEAIAGHWERYGSRPQPVVLEEVLRRVGERLGEAERAELERETSRVLATNVPEDPAFVLDQVREWAEYAAAAQGVLRAAGLLDAGPSSLPAVRDLLARSTEPIAAADPERSTTYLGGAEERLAAWRRGDEYGERIQTGFADLDSVLRGGPTRGEVFYFLAPPKGGKTAALLHVTKAASRRRFGVYLATYEMRAIRMALRLDRSFSRQSKEELREDLARLERAVEGLRLAGAGEVFIDERPSQEQNCVQQARRRVDRLRREGKKIDLVVLDYLNIMGSAREEREKRHELSRISREMGTFAKADGVLVWSACLVKRAAVDKRVVRKTDIAEAYEVIAVMDGGVAICGTKEMRANGFRRLFVVAAREEADEIKAGDYRVDFPRMLFDPADEEVVNAIADSPDKVE